MRSAYALSFYGLGCGPYHLPDHGGSYASSHGGRMTGNRSMRRSEPPAIRSSEVIEAEHFGAWQEWLKDLTPDERVALERMQLDAPKPARKLKRIRRDEAEEDPGVGTCDHLSASDSISGQRQLDPAEALMEAEEAVDDGIRHELALLAYVLPVIVDAENPRLEASFVALALRIGVRQGITLEKLREKHKKGISWMERQVRAWEVKLGLSRASLALLKVVMSPILASRNPRLEAECIAMAARFGLSGGASMTERGEFHGVCKAAVSARVRTWVKDFGLVPRASARSKPPTTNSSTSAGKKPRPSPNENPFRFLEQPRPGPAEHRSVAHGAEHQGRRQ